MQPNIPELIDEAYSRPAAEKPRRYIGASGIGAKCDAELAWSLRGFPNAPIPPKLQRIFFAGHRIEDWVISDLIKAGLHVMEHDPLTGKQWAFNDFGGHISGHADGLVEDDDREVLLLEIKSMNERKWREFEKKGVQYSHPHYYAQVQFMMGLGNIEVCMFVAYNKNTSDYHAEYIDFDVFYYEGLKDRAERILRGEGTRVATDQSDWRCKGCFKRTVCWDEVAVLPQCTYCIHAVPQRDGTWDCNYSFGNVCDKYAQFNPGYRDD